MSCRAIAKSSKVPDFLPAGPMAVGFETPVFQAPSPYCSVVLSQKPVGCAPQDGHVAGSMALVQATFVLPEATSNTQCREFSMPQCPRMRASRARAYRLSVLPDLNRGFFVPADYSHGAVRKTTAEPTTSRTFSAKNSPVDSLKVKSTCGSIRHHVGSFRPSSETGQVMKYLSAVILSFGHWRHKNRLGHGMAGDSTR